MDIHPLQTWLDEHKMKPYELANQIGVGPHTIYRLLAGDRLNPRVVTLAKIEGATGIRAQTILAWAYKRATQGDSLTGDAAQSE